MRIRTAGVIAALAAVLFGSGCTGGDASPQPSPSASTVGTLVIWADSAQAGALQPYAARYGREHRLTVDVQTIPEDRQARFLAASEAGQPPDIVLGGSDWIGALVGGTAIDPVPLSGDQQRAFAETAMRAVTLNGQVYGVPYTVDNVAMIRNVDLAPLPPVTIEEAAAIGRQLKEAGKVTQPVGYPVGENGDFRSAYPLYSSAGGALFGAKANGDYNADDLLVGRPESVAAFAELATLGERGAGALSPSVTAAGALALFTSRATVYLVAGAEAVAEIKRAGVTYDISPVPGVAGGKAAQPLVGAQAFFVASRSRHKAAAQDFVANYVTTPEVAVALYRAQPRPPALTAAVEQIRSTDPDAQKFLDVAKGGAVLPVFPQMGPVWDALGRAQVTVLAGADAPATVYAGAATIRTALR